MPPQLIVEAPLFEDSKKDKDKLDVLPPSPLIKSTTLSFSKIEDFYEIKMKNLSHSELKFKTHLQTLFEMGYIDFELNLKHLKSEKPIEQVIEMIDKD